MLPGNKSGTPPAPYKKIHKENWTAGKLQKFLIACLLIGLTIAILLPICSLIYKAFTSSDGSFIGFQNFIDYFSTSYLYTSIVHTLSVSTWTMVISVTLAFLYAYALTRSNMKFKTMFMYIGFVPLFAPTMMHGIALVLLFGNNGLLTTGFFGFFEETFGWSLAFEMELYGKLGIIISEVIYTFPQALLILMVALSVTDNRLYEAADSMGAGTARKLFTITIPGARQGIIAAASICFTLSFTDFGAPKVVGGQYNVLATDVYKQVVGQQELSMGATIGILLIIPALLAFILDRFMQRNEKFKLSSGAKPYEIPDNKGRDWLLGIYCSVISGAILLLLAAIFLVAFTKVWPYDMTFTLDHLLFKNTAGEGLTPFYNSLLVAFITAIIGTTLSFGGAYLIRKSTYMPFARSFSYLLSMMPLALPGLVIGLAYIFFFNQSSFAIPFTDTEISNPFQVLYGTMWILVLANIVHFYSVTFMTGSTALQQLDKEYEPVAETMGVPFYRTFSKVTVPLTLPAILEIGMYYFINSMTTISAVVFLYPADFKLASISIISRNDAGDIASAAAMALLILGANVVARIVYEILRKIIFKKTAAWR